ncbi:MAG: ribosome small subunit-dependent GTPase A [Gammaproteobacteria bacterium]|nr:ribosome small subunit-dependent GTPase A [Gammaproteobacteria bacterium]
MLSNHGHISRVEDATGRVHRCTTVHRHERPVCGDRVRWALTGSGQGRITAIAPRTSLLARPDFNRHSRPMAANIDRVYVVIATAPPFQLPLLDRYLVAIEHLGLAGTVVLNKADLPDPETLIALRRELSLYEGLGYPLVYTSTATDHGLDELTAAMAGAAGILVGQSGVGKSSITRSLIPDLDIPVGELGVDTMGRHTTTATTLYSLPGGGAIIDSPGVRDFGLWHIPARDVAWGFIEFRPHIPECRFRDCRHRDEPGCAVTAAVARGHIARRRLESYWGILEGLERQGEVVGDRRSGVVNSE